MVDGHPSDPGRGDSGIPASDAPAPASGTPHAPAPAAPEAHAPASSSSWLESHQVGLYFVAIAAGAAVGLGAKHVGLPRLPAMLAWWITPTLALLLFATFLSVPVTRLARAFRDVRFVASIVGVNFFVIPWLVFGLSRFVADDRALLVGMLLVLLAPCIDYVIPFTGLAGGARARLLASTPILLVLQMAFLPVYLLMFVGPGQVIGEDMTGDFFDPGPFISAFAFLIMVPLAAAVVMQAIGGRTDSLDDAPATAPSPAKIFAGGVERFMAAAMVPLMMATLGLVIASQIDDVLSEFGRLARLVPLYVAFVPIALFFGVITAKLARLDVPATRAIGFSATTRNSLVVLPLALALPAGLELAALAVVTQTMVELVAMVILVKTVPKLIRSRTA